MSVNTKEQVVNLLKTYLERERKIALLHYELEHTAHTYAHLDTTAKSTSAAKMSKAFSISPGIQASPW